MNHSSFSKVPAELGCPILIGHQNSEFFFSSNKGYHAQKLSTEGELLVSETARFVTFDAKCPCYTADITFSGCVATFPALCDQIPEVLLSGTEQSGFCLFCACPPPTPPFPNTCQWCPKNPIHTVIQMEITNLQRTWILDISSLSNVLVSDLMN